MMDIRFPRGPSSEEPQLTQIRYSSTMASVLLSNSYNATPWDYKHIIVLFPVSACEGVKVSQFEVLELVPQID